MDKNGGFFSVLFLMILLVSLCYSGYYLYQYWPREPVTLNRISVDEQTINIENNIPSKQFYERMRYSDKIISYFIASSCSSKNSESIIRAMRNLENLTILSFKEKIESKAELKILCSNVAPKAGEENHFVAGEGGPSKILNSTLYSVILEGKIALYREESCPESKVATHELLHALGFNHNNNSGSIMYPILKCNQQIDEEIINSINKLYAVKSLPDLVIYTSNATKSGRYLNFHIEVLNQGLIFSGPVEIEIYANDKFVERFDMGAISIGSRKLLDVENLKIPNYANKIDFRVDVQNLIEEIDEQNNEVVLQINP